MSRSVSEQRGESAATVAIDWTRCDGHGLCAVLLPKAISRDDWGYPVIDTQALAAEAPAAVNRAIACCPALALRR